LLPSTFHPLLPPPPVLFQGWSFLSFTTSFHYAFWAWAKGFGDSMTGFRFPTFCSASFFLPPLCPLQAIPKTQGWNEASFPHHAVCVIGGPSAQSPTMKAVKRYPPNFLSSPPVQQRPVQTPPNFFPTRAVTTGSKIFPPLFPDTPS